MHVIVLATQKGGSGKSTLAVGLALAASQSGHTVRLIETDPQGTLSNWQSRRGIAEPFVETLYNADDVEARLQSLQRGGVTIAIIDTAGGQNAVTNAAIRACDLCLIPVRPSVADIEAGTSTLNVVRISKRPFAFVLNQTPIRGQRIHHAASALSDGGAVGLTDVLALPFIATRNDHQDALRAGLAVSEYAPSGKSADEIRGLWQWVEARLNGGVLDRAPRASEDATFPIPLCPAVMHEPIAAPRSQPLPAWEDSNASWDAGL
jgi:chromosome partitioning protein